MEGIPSASRRSLLKRGLLLLAGGLGLGVAGSRTAAKVSRGFTALKLQGQQWHAFAQDRQRGELPVRGDRISTFGVLSAMDGSKLGEFYATGFTLHRPLGPGPFAAASLELHTFNLADGTIAGMGSSGSNEGVFAIVGGTGRYSGATGSYVARQHPLELGGDGTAEFSLTLKTQEGGNGG